MAEGKKVGSLFVELLVKSEGFKKGMAGAKKSMTTFRSKLGRIASGAIGIFKKLTKAVFNWKVALIAIVPAMLAIRKGFQWLKAGVKGIVAASSSYEQLRLSLRVLLKDQEKANAAFKEGLEISKQTPFDITEVLEQYKLLLAYQFKQKEIPKVLMLASDAATAFGKNLGEVVRGISYLKAGRIEESLAGMGVTREALKERGVEFDSGGALKSSAEELMKAVFGMWEETVGGISAEGVKTWKGMVSNLKNEWKDFEARIGEAGFFDAIKNKLSGILSLINQWATDGRIQDWAQFISDKMTSVLNGVTKIIAALTGIDLSMTSEVEVVNPRFEEVKNQLLEIEKLMNAANDRDDIGMFSELEMEYHELGLMLKDIPEKAKKVNEALETPTWAQSIIDAVEKVKTAFKEAGWEGIGKIVGEGLVGGIVNQITMLKNNAKFIASLASLGTSVAAAIAKGMGKGILTGAEDFAKESGKDILTTILGASAIGTSKEDFDKAFGFSQSSIHRGENLGR